MDIRLAVSLRPSLHIAIRPLPDPLGGSNCERAAGLSNGRFGKFLRQPCRAAYRPLPARLDDEPLAQLFTTLHLQTAAWSRIADAVHPAQWVSFA